MVTSQEPGQPGLSKTHLKIMSHRMSLARHSLLVVLSVLGLVNSGPLSVVIGLCAVIGGLQALGVIGGDAPRAV